MPLTKDFKITVMTRIYHDSTFRNAILFEAMNEFLTGDFHVGTAIIRDYINAIIDRKLL